MQSSDSSAGGSSWHYKAFMNTGGTKSNEAFGQSSGKQGTGGKSSDHINAPMINIEQEDEDSDDIEKVDEDSDDIEKADSDIYSDTDNHNETNPPATSSNDITRERSADNITRDQSKEKSLSRA